MIDLLPMREMAFAALCVLGMQPILVEAQVVPLASAIGSKPVVGTTANGMPVVQIATPNGAGVSNNSYTSFNVGTQGLILNNSPTNMPTQQAGYVAGNPNIVGNSANVIVNQVAGGSASQLLGYMEVAGPAADVIVANPSGIYCNGCGFINTNRGVLTTGTPVFGGSGSLDAFHVTGGQVQIGTTGLNAGNIDEVDLIARSVQVNGQVWANKSINAVVGVDDVQYSNLATTVLTPDANHPAVAIDVAQLGGMYAGKITLVGTEAGVGVNSSGTIAAQSGDVSINNQGQVTLAGTTSASGNVAVNSATGISNAGQVYAGQNATLSSEGEIGNSGTVAALGDTSINAASVDSTGALGAGIAADGNATGSGKLSVSATGAVSATGQNLAGGNLAISGSSVNLAGAQTMAGGNVSLSSTAGNVDNTGAQLSANGALNVSASGALINDQGVIGTNGSMTIQAASASNRSGSLATAQTFTINTGALDNTAGQIATNQFNLTASSLVNAQGTLTQFGTALMGLNVSGLLDNSNGGTIETNSQSTTLAPGQLNNNGGTIVDTGTGALSITPGGGSGSLANAGGTIASNGGVTIVAGSADNTSGLVAAQGALSATIQGTLNNTSGQLSSGGAMSVSSGGALSNANGQIDAGTLGGATTLNVTAASIDNTNGELANSGIGAATIDGGSQITNSNAAGVAGMGQITGNGAVTISAKSISNVQGAQLSGGSLQVNGSTLNNAGGSIGNVGSTTGDVDVTTSTLANTGGQIGANQNLNITASALSGDGAYSAGNNLGVTLTGDLTSAASFTAGNNLMFTLPGALANSGAMVAVNNLSINAHDIVNSGAMAAGNLLSAQSNTLINTGTIVGGSVALSVAKSILNQGPAALIGATSGTGALVLLAPTISNIDNTTTTDSAPTTAIYGLGAVVLAGGVDANGNYTNADQIANSSGLIQSAGDMTLAANQVTNTRTTMQTAYTSNIDPNLLASMGISMSGCTAVQMAACGPGNPQVGWLAVDPADFVNMIGGTPIVPPTQGQWNSGYQYTTYTGVATAYVVSAISPQGQIVSGGNINASTVGELQLRNSAIAAAGNLNIDNSHITTTDWQGQTAPQVMVTYSGQYHYDNYDDTEYNWQVPFGTASVVTGNPGDAIYNTAAPADIRTYALPSYGSTVTANGTISGTGVTIDNTAGNTGIPSLGLKPGQNLHGTTNPVIAGATALNVLNNIAVPKGGLFSVDSAPNAPYLIETNPAFTNQQNFLSSNYYFQLLGMNPSDVHMRLGDGFYEQQLVQDQILSLTGKSVLINYADTQDEYEALMTSGAELAKSLDLAPGTGLSAAQVAALTSNVVIMQTQVVDGQSVLVPVVYLAQASQQNMGNGPVIAATNIDLENAKSITNSGTIAASNNLTLAAQAIDSTNGTLAAGNQMALVSAGNINLTSATVSAGSLGVQAGGNLILDTATNTVNQVSAGGTTRSTTTLGPTASINVANDATIITGGNFEQNAGNLNVGGALTASIGGNWTMGVQQTGETKTAASGIDASYTHGVVDTGSNVNVGGASQIAVGGDLTAAGANINLGGGGTIAANGNVNLQAATATSTLNAHSSSSDSHGSSYGAMQTSNDVVTGTTLTSGNNLTVVAGKDLNVTGSTVDLTQGTATLAAQGNVNIDAANETHTSNVQSSGSHGGVMSSTSEAGTSNVTATYANGSTISADSVNIQAGKDLNVAGSTIVGTNDVDLAAANNVNITTTQNTLQASSSYEEQHSGFATSGLTVSLGTSSQEQADQQSSVTNNGSAVASLNGNVSISAGNNLHVTGSELYANQDINLGAKSVTIDSAYDTATQADQQSAHQAGITLGASNAVVAAVQTGVQMASAAKQVDGDPRLMALAAATTGLAAMNTYNALTKSGGNPVSTATSIGVNASIGASSSRSQSNEQSSTAVGSTVTAGRNVTIAASGAGANSNINVIGSTVSAANNVLLAADGKVNLEAAQSTTSQTSSNSGSSASLGVTFSVGSSTGVSVNASLAGSKGSGNGSSVTNNNTQVIAGNTLAIESGGDTNLIGAVASGKQVIGNIGGNLNVQSLQDTSTYNSNQQSAGLSGSICVTPGCTSWSVMASAGQTKINSNYQSVNQQSGIQAGDAGFQINVKGNTGLTGAYIASSNAPASSLVTGTLTHSDIQNSASYSGSQLSLSGGYQSAGQSSKSSNGSTGAANSSSAIGQDQQGTANNTNPIPNTTLPNYHGITVAPPVALSASGSSSSTTSSAISGGAITITNGEAQQQLTGQTAAQAVASISRDTSSTAGTLAPIFDLNKVQAGFAITSQFVNQVGTFVASKAAEADSAKQALTAQQALPMDQQNPALIAQLTQTLQNDATWQAGGTGRMILTALTAAAGGNVSGTSAQFVQAGVANYFQQEGVLLIGQLVANGTISAGSATQSALHALVGCLGAAGGGQSCAGGAIGAAAGAVATTLTLNTVDPNHSPLTADQSYYASAVSGMVGSVLTGVLGDNVNAAATAAEVEADDNGTKHWVTAVVCWLCVSPPHSIDGQTDAGSGPINPREDVLEYVKPDDIRAIPPDPFQQNPR